MYKIENVEQVASSGKLRFLKLFIDNKCDFDDFCSEIENNAQDKKSLVKILATMDYMAEYNGMLPSTKFNSIKDKSVVIGYEFKQDRLRIYCMKVKPNIVLLFGGYKAEQKKDVKKLVRLTKEIKRVLPDLIEQMEL